LILTSIVTAAVVAKLRSSGAFGKLATTLAKKAPASPVEPAAADAPANGL